MVSDLHDQGEEVMQKHTWRRDLITLPETVQLLLYEDGTLNAGAGLGDADDIGAITTEPSTGNYARKTLAILSGTATANDGNLTVSLSGGNWIFEVPALTWDVTNTTGTVDAYGIVMNVQLNGDAGAVDHLVFTQLLDAAYDLSGDTTLDTPAGGGMSLN